MLRKENVVKVDKSISPTPSTVRKEPTLTVGADYYVCFGNNIAYPCTLIEIIGGSPKRIRISKKDKGEIFGEHEFCRKLLYYLHHRRLPGSTGRQH